MGSIAQMIPVVQKAANVCGYCRVRKQRCDRTLPRCQRCEVKNHECDYTPYKEPTRNSYMDANGDPLVIVRDECSHADLSMRGTAELVRCVAACIYADDARSVAAADTQLTELAYNILDLAELDLPTALAEFGPCVQQWCPILPEDLLHGRENDLSVLPSSRGRLQHPLFVLCVWLVTSRACRQCGTMTKCQLYCALKQIVSVLQASGEVSLDVMRIGLLVAVFELGHGMQNQVFQTLATCVATLRLVEFAAKEKGGGKTIETVEWLKASCLMIDRMIPLTSLSTSIFPLTIPSDDPISLRLSSTLAPTIPQPSPTPLASSPRKVHIRTAVALASGRVLEYIHARQQHLSLGTSYGETDKIISDCIHMLVEKPQPHTWLHCDAIALAFCSCVVLHQAEVAYLRGTAISNPTDSNAEFIKASLALTYARRMAWDMVLVAIEKIAGEEEVPFLPFAGLCCVLRAGWAVLETRGWVMDDEYVVRREEVEGFVRILEWFGARWEGVWEYLEAGRKVLEGWDGERSIQNGSDGDVEMV